MTMISLWYPLLVTALMPLSIKACGGFFCEPNVPVVQAGESIAFGVNGREMEMHVQILYQGPAEQFSWLLPVPFTPQVDVGSDILFRRLFSTTMPSFEFRVEEPDPSSIETCSQGESICAVQGGIDLEDSAADADTSADDAEVLEEGSVGPFDFVVLAPAENNPDSIRQWLGENGYDEYEGSAALLNYYALLDHKFVALKLRKGTETGEIQPVILRMTMPEGMDAATAAIACIPIKLTAVAANEDMPITAYILGDSQATPINWYGVELDDKQVPWLLCQSFQNCYLQDMRTRFRLAASAVNQTVFLTEYAGSSSIMDNQIAFDIDIDALKGAETPLEYVNLLNAAGVPASPLFDGCHFRGLYSNIKN